MRSMLAGLLCAGNHQASLPGADWATLSSLSWLDIILMCWIVKQFYHVYRFDYLSCPFTLM